MHVLMAAQHMLRKMTLVNFAVLIFLIFAAADCAAQTAVPSPAPTPAPLVASTGTDSLECMQARTMLMRQETRLRDWPALARYRDENAKTAVPNKKEKRVVFLGDSITDSWDNPANGGFFPGKPYLNRGISGQTTPQMLIRFRRDVIELKPRVVVILAGTNDIAGNTGPTTLEAIQDNLKSMAELASANRIRVVFASVMPVSDYVIRDAKPLVQTVRRPPEKILALNKWMQEFARINHHTYLDYFSAMVDDKGFLKDELSNDGLHPNAQGYAVMVPLAKAAIKASLKRSK